MAVGDRYIAHVTVTASKSEEVVAGEDDLEGCETAQAIAERIKRLVEECPTVEGDTFNVQVTVYAEDNPNDKGEA